MSDKLQSGIKAGSSSVSLRVSLQNSTDGSDVTGKVYTDIISAAYWRQGGSPIEITPVSLATIDSVYSSGGFKEADSDLAPGEYRFDIPDSAVATGSDWVDIIIVVSDCLTIKDRYPLTTNVIQLGDSFGRIGPLGSGLTALATVAAIVEVILSLTTTESPSSEVPIHPPRIPAVSKRYRL